MADYKPANATDFSGLERFVLENRETLNNIGTQVCEVSLVSRMQPWQLGFSCGMVCVHRRPPILCGMIPNICLHGHLVCTIACS